MFLNLPNFLVFVHATVDQQLLGVLFDDTVPKFVFVFEKACDIQVSFVALPSERLPKNRGGQRVIVDDIKSFEYVELTATEGASSVAIIAVVNVESILVWQLVHQRVNRVVDVVGLPVIVREE